MSIKEFMTKVYEMLEQKNNGEYVFSTNEITKANDVIYHAITVSKKGENIGKNIYLESYYEKYKLGCEIDEIIKDIVSELDENREFIESTDTQNLLKGLANYEEIKDKIVFKLVNKEKNSSFLHDKLYREFLDMAIVYQIALNNPEEGLAVCYVHPKFLKHWNVTEEELYAQAFENIQTMLPARIRTLEDILSGFVDGDMEEFLEDKYTPFYVLSNVYGVNGAATVLYTDVLKEFADEYEVQKVLIIPSSSEEVLLIPLTFDQRGSEAEYRRILLEVNDTIEKHLWLSDNIYIYNREKDSIRIWTE